VCTTVNPFLILCQRVPYWQAATPVIVLGGKEMEITAHNLTHPPLLIAHGATPPLTNKLTDNPKETCAGSGLVKVNADKIAPISRHSRPRQSPKLLWAYCNFSTVTIVKAKLALLQFQLLEIAKVSTIPKVSSNSELVLSHYLRSLTRWQPCEMISIRSNSEITSGIATTWLYSPQEIHRSTRRYLPFWKCQTLKKTCKLVYFDRKIAYQNFKN